MSSNRKRNGPSRAMKRKRASCLEFPSSKVSRNVATYHTKSIKKSGYLTRWLALNKNFQGQKSSTGMFKSHFWQFCGAFFFANFGNFMRTKLPKLANLCHLFLYRVFSSILLPNLTILGHPFLPKMAT